MQVFLSYASADLRANPDSLTSFFNAIKLNLEAAQQGSLWRDETNLEEGLRWRDQLADQIDASDVILLLVSPAWAASEVCWREYTSATQKSEPCLIYRFPYLLQESFKVPAGREADLEKLLADMHDQHNGVFRKNADSKDNGLKASILDARDEGARHRLIDPVLVAVKNLRANRRPRVKGGDHPPSKEQLIELENQIRSLNSRIAQAVERQDEEAFGIAQIDGVQPSYLGISRQALPLSDWKSRLRELANMNSPFDTRGLPIVLGQFEIAMVRRSEWEALFGGQAQRPMGLRDQTDNRFGEKADLAAIVPPQTGKRELVAADNLASPVAKLQVMHIDSSGKVQLMPGLQNRTTEANPFRLVVRPRKRV